VPLLMVVECGVLLGSRRIGLEPFAGALLSILLFVVSAVGLAALLAPLMEDGAIALSARLGDAVDAGAGRLSVAFFRAVAGLWWLRGHALAKIGAKRGTSRR
jgi:hypothetical protein